jgi:hypothetical protein
MSYKVYNIASMAIRSGLVFSITVVPLIEEERAKNFVRHDHVHSEEAPDLHAVGNDAFEIHTSGPEMAGEATAFPNVRPAHL